MISSCQKKSVILIGTCLAISLLLLTGMPSTAFASSKQTTVSMSPKGATSSQAKSGNATKNGYGYTPSKPSNGKNSQVNTQYKEGNTYNSNNSSYAGINQGNSGNLGYNRGFNQNNSSNSGNQINNTKRTYGNQVNTQVTRSNNYNSNNSYYSGTNQGNSGNLGYNRGFNQNNSSNSGNQINN
ncbi:hypothetical protein [Ktedonobacter sp. SOSP1-85]|uniref:hypothetical protein n=1 Tax=Ktedonobacter sp. SOSP1-85 TaxID=2778367 RepID=UPI001F2E4A33|nr:hypothetical protein [Ktedonobacter sp. SOSP1-85]